MARLDWGWKQKYLRDIVGLVSITEIDYFNKKCYMNFVWLLSAYKSNIDNILYYINCVIALCLKEQST